MTKWVTVLRHAKGQDLINAVSEINAKTVFSVHAEHPDVCKKITEDLILIDEGVKYEIGNKKWMITQ